MGAVDFVRIGESELELEIPMGWFERGAIIFRPVRPFQVKERIQRNGFDATIYEVNERGHPTRVRFQFEGELDNPRYRWMIWKGAYYEEYRFSGILGEGRSVPDPMMDILKEETR